MSAQEQEKLERLLEQARRCLGMLEGVPGKATALFRFAWMRRVRELEAQLVRN